MAITADQERLDSSEGSSAGDSRHERSRLIRTLGYAVTALALAVTSGTFFLILDLTPISPTAEAVFWARVVNAALVGLLVILIGWEVWTLLRARRSGRAASRLHIRIVTLFSLIAAIPAILVAVFASVTVTRGLDYWFSERIQALVSTSQQVADAYLQEQGRGVGLDLLAMKTDFEQAMPQREADPERFQSYINAIAVLRKMPWVAIVRRDGTTIARANISQQEYPPAPLAVFADADASNGIPILIAPGSTNLVGGLVRLASMPDAYVYVVRPVDPTVVANTSLVEEHANEYSQLQATRADTQIAFTFTYISVSLVLLLSAIWLGISVANRIVAPIRNLIDATDSVAKGDLGVRVPVRSADGDIGALAATFNKMTGQLRGQRRELLGANEQIDSRRRFTEAVLSGVTAGVVGVDGGCIVRIVNRAALRLLAANHDAMVGKMVTEIVPELKPLVTAALSAEKADTRGQITILRAGRERTINVRVTRERTTAGDQGYVVTLDDITDLVTAQRNSAWADIARRIAHEIKNPLTPIQLSAERLKRRFGKTIVEDKAIFDQSTDTIIRQVGYIGQMVDEFSAFARMPKPEFEDEKDLAEAIREAAFLMQVTHSDLTIDTHLGREPLLGRFDLRLLSQAFTNVVKNATEAIAAVPIEERGPGRISIEARTSDDTIIVDVIDNGIGLPAENRDRLLEPYMTTREKGTGLGLAIVRKIIEEHGGRIELLDSPAMAEGGRGALVRITLPRLTRVTRGGAGDKGKSTEPEMTGTGDGSRRPHR